MIYPSCILQDLQSHSLLSQLWTGFHTLISSQKTYHSDNPFFPGSVESTGTFTGRQKHLQCDTIIAFSHLFLINCEGVGDDFFEWLCGEDGYIPALDLQELWLKGCNRFTSGALRNFFATRQAIGRPLVAIKVSGKGPMISRSDLAWFLDGSQTTTYVTWNVEADTSMQGDLRRLCRRSSSSWREYGT